MYTLLSTVHGRRPVAIGGITPCASALISRLAGQATSAGAVALAVFFSAMVEIGFGYYPARKAAFLDPIKALRAE